MRRHERTPAGLSAGPDDCARSCGRELCDRQITSSRPACFNRDARDSHARKAVPKLCVPNHLDAADTGGRGFDEVACLHYREPCRGIDPKFALNEALALILRLDSKNSCRGAINRHLTEEMKSIVRRSYDHRRQRPVFDLLLLCKIRRDDLLRHCRVAIALEHFVFTAL